MIHNCIMPGTQNQPSREVCKEMPETRLTLIIETGIPVTYLALSTVMGAFIVSLSMPHHFNPSTFQFLHGNLAVLERPGQHHSANTFDKITTPQHSGQHISFGLAFAKV